MHPEIAGELRVAGGHEHVVLHRQDQLAFTRRQRHDPRAGGHDSRRPDEEHGQRSPLERRVGLRYAHEGGYDVTKGPALWNRFKEKYGESGVVVNFFFGGHSRSSRRVYLLQAEIDNNYSRDR